MGGLEKITAHILENANEEAETIKQDATNTVEEINQNEKVLEEELINRAEEQLKGTIENLTQMSSARDKHEKRQIILDAKSKIIEDIIKRSKDKILNMEKEDYFKILKKLLEKSMDNGNGKVLFSKNDKMKINKDFILEFEKLSNGRLKVSDETADINNGFIIRYEKIDINCSIDAIFEAMQNELTDLVSEYITDA